MNAVALDLGIVSKMNFEQAKLSWISTNFDLPIHISGRRTDQVQTIKFLGVVYGQHSLVRPYYFDEIQD